MRNHNLAIILGLATTILVSTPFPAQAQAKVYEFLSGKESVRFDAEGLEVLESIGLSLASVENTAVPAPGYTYAFDLFPPSDQKNTFTFSYDDATEDFEPIGGTVDLTGSLFFNVDTTKLNLPPQLELGDLFAIPAVDLNVYDTVTTGLPVFNLETTGLNIDTQNQTVKLNFETMISKEFSDFLVDKGATTSIAGLKIGQIQGDRNIVEVEKVPEPGSVLAILTAAGAALSVGKRYRRDPLLPQKASQQS